MGEAEHIRRWADRQRRVRLITALSVARSAGAAEGLAYLEQRRSRAADAAERDSIEEELRIFAAELLKETQGEA